jgi:hypothetical protein
MIGMCEAPLMGVGRAFPPKPTWVTLWRKDPMDPDDKRGAILVSFQVTLRDVTIRYDTLRYVTIRDDT